MFLGNSLQIGSASRLARSFCTSSSLDVLQLESRLPRDALQKARFQRPGLCHVEAFDYAADVAGIKPLLNFDRQSLAGPAEMSARHYFYAHISSPFSFEPVPCDEQSLIAALDGKTPVVVQGAGRDPLIAPDSGLLHEFGRYSQLAAEAGLKFDERMRLLPHHSVIALAYSPPDNPLPGVAPGHLVLIDQDPYRTCYSERGLDPNHMHQLSPDFIRANDLLKCMLRSAPIEGMLQIKKTAPTVSVFSKPRC